MKIPPGWMLVPVEATNAMCVAAVKLNNGNAVYKNVTAAALEIEEQIYAEVYEAMIASTPPPVALTPLTDAEIELLRENTFSVNNPYCPVDSKSMRKAVRAAERAHGIKGATP